MGENPRTSEPATSTDSMPDPLSDALGYPVPEQVKRNVYKAIGKGIGYPIEAAGQGAANVIASFFKLLAAPIDLLTANVEEATARVRARSDANSIFEIATSKAFAETLGQDPVFVQRAVNRLIGQTLDEQRNRESIARQVLEELPIAAAGRSQSIAEIDEDWIVHYWRIAETKSDLTMQRLFARILAGEVASPGSYSAASLHALTVMPQSLALAFQRVCSAMFYPIGDREPFGFDWLAKEGGYTVSDLSELQALRLIAKESENGLPIDRLEGLTGEYAGARFRIARIDAAGTPHNSGPRCFFLLKYGLELSRLFDKRPNWTVLERVNEHFNKYLHLNIEVEGSPS